MLSGFGSLVADLSTGRGLRYGSSRWMTIAARLDSTSLKVLSNARLPFLRHTTQEASH